MATTNAAKMSNDLLAPNNPDISTPYDTETQESCALFQAENLRQPQARTPSIPDIPPVV